MSPAHPSKNLHHTQEYRNEEEWWEEEFGKGPSDPDRHRVYPGQPE